MRYLLAALLIFNSNWLLGQAQSMDQGRLKIYEAYVYNQSWKWQEGIALLEQAYQQSTLKKDQTLYQLALAEYGYIGYCVAAEKEEDHIDNRIEQALKHTETLLEYNPEQADGHALRGALLAMKIGRSPAKAIFLGPKSTKHINRAIELNPKSPAAWVEKGNMRFHAPAIFGGDMDEAIKCFAKAVNMYDRYPARKQYNWLYIHALTWLGKAYEEQEKWYMARAAYEKLLAFEPDFTWVKNELLPNVQKQIGE